MRRFIALAPSLTLLATAALIAGAALPANADPAEPADTLVLQSPTGASITVNEHTAPFSTEVEVAPSSGGTGVLSELEGEIGLNVGVPESLKELLPPEIDTPEVPSELSSTVEPFSVVGADDRTRVSQVTDAPYVQTPFIGYERGGQHWMCTGWLVGPHAMATAGHCLHQDGEWANNFAIYFGLNNTSAVAACSANLIYAPSQWVSGQSPEYDWGLIQLNCNAGEVFGHYGFRAPGTGAIPADWTITGYPADKHDDNGYTMWQHAGPIQLNTERQLWYTIDTAGGQSGAPIWRLETGTACGNCVIGIHTYGIGGLMSPNSGSKITSQVYDALVLFRDNWLTGA